MGKLLFEGPMQVEQVEIIVGTDSASARLHVAFPGYGKLRFLSSTRKNSHSLCIAMRNLVIKTNAK